MHIELRSIDDQVCNGANVLQVTALCAQGSFHRAVRTERMRAAGLAITAQQDFIRSFEEDHFGGDHPLDRFHDGRQFFQLATFADVDHQSGARIFRRLHQFGEARDQFHRQIINRVVAEVLESFKHRSFAGAAHAGDDYELAGRPT